MVTSVTIQTPPTGPIAPEPNETQVDPNRPEWLPAEFATPEDFAKSYGELRGKFTQTTQELATLKKEPSPVTPPNTDENKPTDPPNDPAKPDDKNASEDPAKKVAEAAGFDLSTYNDEYATTGDVAPENRAKIAEGLKKVLGDDALTVVNQYIDGQKVVHANQLKDFYGAAGGEDNYNRMLEFARATMTDSERNKFNSHINGNDHDVRMMALESLKSRYEANHGRIPNNVRTKAGAASGGVQPFANTAQMVAAMDDPRYDTDGAYRDEIARRIAASPNL